MSTIDWILVIAGFTFGVMQLVIGSVYRGDLTATCGEDSYWKLLTRMSKTRPRTAKVLRILLVVQTAFMGVVGILMLSSHLRVA